MESIKVIYREKEYTVFSPGVFLKDPKGYLLDQLVEGTPRMGRYRSVYLKKVYGLSEYDYYVIVIFGGDENLVPRCGMENCNNPCHFNHLLDTIKEPVFEIGCCKEHTRILVNRISGRRLVDEGRSTVYKAIEAANKIPRDVFRKRARENALKQVAEGRHPWQRKNRKETLIATYNWRTDPKVLEDIVEIFKCERDEYISKGDADKDVCYLYMTELSNNKSVIKIGVTKDIKMRASVKYHGNFYENPKILFTGSRRIVAEMEFAIKLKFRKDLKIGDETFSNTVKNDIIDFVNDFIRSLSSTTIVESS